MERGWDEKKLSRSSLCSSATHPISQRQNLLPLDGTHSLAVMTWTAREGTLCATVNVCNGERNRIRKERTGMLRIIQPFRQFCKVQDVKCTSNPSCDKSVPSIMDPVAQNLQMHSLQQFNRCIGYVLTPELRSSGLEGL